MAAKIQLNFGKIGTFGGIFSTIDAFRKAGLSNLIDNTLGNKGINTKYTYSNIVENLMSTYLCGGECIEDCNLFRTERYQRNPDYRFASADTLLKTFQTLSVNNRTVSAESGKTYQFNVNDKLNGLLLDSLLLCGLVKENAPVVFDYDNQFVAAEKYDAKYSYKKAFGYFPGIAQINLRPFYIENRDGNAQMKLGQADTLKRAFGMLRDRGIKVDKARMDCGSYAKDVVEVAAASSRLFYIRASQCASLAARLEDIPDEDWTECEINFQRCQLASLPFTAFLAEEGYRLVAQRTLVTDPQSTLFDSYVYRCILTNDTDSSEREVVEFYNGRGRSERTFDIMNNDFGWKHLPCSFMRQNTVFMILTALIGNFFAFLVRRVAEFGNFGIEATSRAKRFLFNFIQVPFRWTHSGRRWLLQIYSERPYDKLRL